MESHKQIEERAARFLAKRDSGVWTESDQADFQIWIRAATAHRVAVLRLESAWEEARRLKAIAAGLQPGTVPPPGAWRHTYFFGHRIDAIGRLLSSVSPTRLRVTDRRWRRRDHRLGMVAAILLAIVGGYYLSTTSLFGRGRYSTSVGQIASVRLQDGSVMTLNTNSEVRVKFSDNARRIDLERGEAFFQDVKDPNRPFVVYAGDKRVVAVGTAFSVNVGADDLRVIVIQGAVRLEQSSNEPARPGSAEARATPPERADGSAAPGAGAAAVLLRADMVARATGADLLVQNISLAEAEQALSWRRGYLTFHETTLADAVNQFNGYNSHKMTVSDPGLAGIRISGTFRPTDYQAFVHLLQEAYSIQATPVGNETRLGK